MRELYAVESKWGYEGLRRYSYKLGTSDSAKGVPFGHARLYTRLADAKRASKEFRGSRVVVVKAVVDRTYVEE